MQWQKCIMKRRSGLWRRTNPIPCDEIDSMCTRSMLATRSSRIAAVPLRTAVRTLKSGTWIDKELGYDTCVLYPRNPACLAISRRPYLTPPPIAALSRAQQAGARGGQP